MAYLHKEKRGNYTYLTICKSIRTKTGQVERKVIGRLGNWEDYKIGELENIGKALYTLGGGDLNNLKEVDQNNKVKELSRQNYGFPLIIKSLLRHYELEILVKRFEKKHHLSYSLLDVVTLLLCDRWYEPISKLGSYTEQSDYIGLEKVALRHIYRSLDILSKYEEAIQSHFYYSHKKLFRYGLDVVFFDVTTFYFDSKVEIEGSLRQKGFSKDGKIGKTQVVFGLLIDKHKNPIGYQIYSGNQYEGYTLKDAIQRLKKQYLVKSVTVVADRGMMNKDNLEVVENSDYQYIIGERLKNIGKKAQDYLLDIDNYELGTYTTIDGQKHQVLYTTYNYKGRTIIGTYSEKRAKKDKVEREAKIDKGKKLLKAKVSLRQKAYRYFLKSVGEEVYQIDETKIKQAERFDGFTAIATNHQNKEQINWVEMIDHYRHLFQIEQVFRTFKAHLDIRPMFHWTDKRIRGHITVCYMAFCLLNYLQRQLLKNDTPMSEQKIRKTLAKMQMSKTIIGQQVFFITAKQEQATKQICKTLNIKTLNEMILKQHIDQVLQTF